MPDTLRVRESLSKVKNVVYFGLHENETSEAAHLVIPAKSFLYKNDVRTSYGHNGISFMPKQKDSDVGIGEYELSAYLCREFGIAIEDESFYIEHFKSFAQEANDGTLYVKGRENIPYQDGFDTQNREFVFLDELDLDTNESEGMFLVTSKSLKSLNSQFERQESVYMHSSLGYAEGEEVMISSKSGSVKLRVKHNDDLRKDCVLIYSGTKGVNNLTTSKRSFSGNSAIFQENKVEINR
jgi:anaerobic selenocysteine-containing dehydrogenase